MAETIKGLNGHLLEVQRICKGLSIEELSRRAIEERTKHCGSSADYLLTPAHIDQIESGTVEPTWFQLRWLAKGLGCGIVDLLLQSQIRRIIEHAEGIPEEEWLTSS